MPGTVQQIAKTFSQYCFGVSPAEAVGIDIACSGLNVVNVSLRSSKNSPLQNGQLQKRALGHKPFAHLLDSFAWESRASTEFARPLNKSLEDGAAPSTTSVINALNRHLPRQIDGGPRSANVALPPAASVLRWPSPEQMSELSRAIRNDLGKALLPGDSLESCSWPIGTTGRKMIYAVSGGMTKAIAELLAGLGYSNPCVDSRPHTLAGALQLDARRDAKIIIDWTWSDCSLLISTPPAAGTANTSNQTELARWAVPQLCRPLHGYCLAASDRIGASPTNETFGRRSDELRRQHLLPLFRAAAEEIERTLRFAESLQSIDTSGPIVVCGIAATMPEGLELLSELLDREVRGWRFGGEKRFNSNAQQYNESLFAVAIAAACRMLA